MTHTPDEPMSPDGQGEGSGGLLNEWQLSLIRRRLAALEAGEPTLPHEEVERRLASKITTDLAAALKGQTKRD